MILIRERRKKTGISQKELSDALGVTQGAVSQWENGTTRPDIDLLPKIAALLNCTVDELLNDKSQQQLNNSTHNI